MSRLVWGGQLMNGEATRPFEWCGVEMFRCVEPSVVCFIISFFGFSRQSLSIGACCCLEPVHGDMMNSE